MSKQQQTETKQTPRKSVKDFSDHEMISQWTSMMGIREDTKFSNMSKNTKYSTMSKNYILREQSMTLSEKMRLGDNLSPSSSVGLSPVKSVEGIEWFPGTSNLADVGETSYPNSYNPNTQSRATMTSSRVNSSLLMNVSVTDNTKALLEAAEQGNPGKVKEVLRHGSVDPDYKRNASFRTALERACGYGQVDVVRELIESGADPEQTNMVGRTLLHDACTGGHVEIVRMLLDYIQDVDSVDKAGRSAAHLAAFHGETACISLLADKGADLILEDNTGKMPAHLAAERNHPKILEHLTERGVDLEIGDEQGKKPAHYAAMFGGLECLIFLVQIDCDMTKTDNLGQVPAHCAAAYDHIDCLRYLVKSGLPFDIKDGCGKSLAHAAAHRGAMTCLHWLFEKGLDANQQDDHGNTPLHMAAVGGNAKCFNCCLQHNSSLEIRNKKEETGLDTARRFGHPVVIGKAVDNEIQCLHCVDKFDLLTWEKNHQPTNVQKSIKTRKQVIYKSPVPTAKKEPSRMELNKERRDKLLAKKGQGDEKLKISNVPKRDLPTKYYFAAQPPKVNAMWSTGQ